MRHFTTFRLKSFHFTLNRVIEQVTKKEGIKNKEKKRCCCAVLVRKNVLWKSWFETSRGPCMKVLNTPCATKACAKVFVGCFGDVLKYHPRRCFSDSFVTL